MKMKKIICAALAGGMLLSSIPAMASDINIKIDGEEFIPKNALGEEVYPFIESGSTYLPVRAMGEAVGKEVAFDAENYSVYIGVRPMAEEVNKTPVIAVGDTVYYDSDVKEFGSIENLLVGEKTIKLAEEMFDKDEINKLYRENLAIYEAYYAQYGETLSENLKHMIYSASCAHFVIKSIELTEADYDGYVTVKHVLAKTEEEAIAVIAELEKGIAIESLIEEYNIDPGQTSDSSYTFTYGEMVQEFEKASFALKEGEFTKEPVPTSYGYHVILRLPLDKASIEDILLEQAFLIVMENVELDKVVRVTREGDWGRIDNIIFTTDDLKAVYKMFTGNINDIEYEEAFEYTVLMIALNNIGRERQIVADTKEAFSLEYEMGLFNVLYEAMFGGAMIVSEEELFDACEKLDIEIYRELKVFVDGKLLVPGDVNNNYVAPKNIDGTVYVPVRAIVEALGMTADWDNETRTVIIEK